MGLLSRWMPPWFAPDPNEAKYLNDPNTAPGANAPQQGPFVEGRGRPLDGYGSFAPMPPTGVVAPFGVPQAGSPGGHGDFAGYANQSMGLLTAPRPTFSQSPARSLIPDAPASARPSETDNAAWADARRRAQAAIQQEGYPYWQSPSVVASGDALSEAIERDRAARAEQQRRESVSWPEWWHWGGRQDDESWTPDQPAYRFSPAPTVTQTARSRQQQRGRR